MRLYGKQRLKEQLDFIASRGHLPHAILLNGERGIGRKVMAGYIAKLFLCGTPPCDNCAICSRIDAGTHPDIIYVKRECGGKYNLAESDRNLVSLRRVMESIAIKPNDGNIKIYIFEDANEMTVQMQNTLLKTIEEPAEFLRFIFTCENTDSIIETIRSRITMYDVPSTTAEECSQCLIDSGNDAATSHELAQALSGNIGKCLDVISGAGDTPYMETARKAASAIASGSGFALAAALSKQSGRQEFAITLDYLTTILRDALAHRCGAQLSSCGKKEAQAIDKKYDEEKLLSMLDVLFAVAEDASLNLNIALTASYITSKLI